MKHYRRFFGGIGIVFINYASLRLLEHKSTMFFLLVFFALSYGTGLVCDDIE